MQPPITEQAAWCRDALAVQNACNLSGVAHSWADLCVAMHRSGLSTTAQADHPACILYAAKAADLCGLHYHYPAAAEAAANELIQRAEAEAHPSGASPSGASPSGASKALGLAPVGP